MKKWIRALCLTSMMSFGILRAVEAQTHAEQQAQAKSPESLVRPGMPADGYQAPGVVRRSRTSGSAAALDQTSLFRSGSRAESGSTAAASFSSASEARPAVVHSSGSSGSSSFPAAKSPTHSGNSGGASSGGSSASGPLGEVASSLGLNL